MAYIDQAKKSELSVVVKKILAKNGLKGSLSISNHSMLTLTISQGSIDFISNCNAVCSADHTQPMFRPITSGTIEVNVYHIDRHFSGRAKSVLNQLRAAMMYGNHDNSDSQLDYFDVGWYVSIRIGKWNKPYTLV